MNPFSRLIWLGAALLAFNVYADDLSGSRKLLCSTQSVSQCASDGICNSVLPEDLNIPQFIEVDTKAGILSTTAASGESRETQVDETSSADGHLLMQGMETGRAYSLLIDEATGMASFASVTDGMAVIVFSACTPR